MKQASDKNKETYQQGDYWTVDFIPKSPNCYCKNCMTDNKENFMKFKKRSLAKTFKNTSFRLFALQPSTGKMIAKK